VFATPGADAVHAFDTANLHERGDLWQLAADVSGFRRFLATSGFGGPLWVTEHGYPADPHYQYDPGHTAGEAAQASYLAASIPTLVDAGATAVFDVVRAIADCFTALGRDCPDAPATASPSTALLGPAAPGQTSTTSLTVATGRECTAAWGEVVSAMTTQPAALRWVRAPRRCRRAPMC
jgi:hypothetical protein